MTRAAPATKGNALPQPRSPNFLIVGVTKGGTTFLAKALSEHPDVFFSRPKEPFFFNRPKMTAGAFLRYQNEFFGGATDQRWVGEGSTNYFHHKQAISFIERLLGDQTRIIVCLRHPIDRMFSHYLHDFKRKRVQGGERLDEEIFEGYIQRSLYAKRLKLWESRFPHLKVLFFDDLQESATKFYGNAARFLEIEPQPIEDTPVNEGMRMAWQGDWLTLSSKSEPGAGQVIPRFSRADVEALRERFIQDVKRTQDVTGRELPGWKRLPDFGLLEQKFAATS
jgi:hypothetical protein